MMHTLAPISEPAFVGGIGGPELLIILLIILLLFGSKKLPELAKGMGKSIREFKKATEDVENDFRSAMDAADVNKPQSESPKERVETPASDNDASPDPAQHEKPAEKESDKAAPPS